MITQLTKKIIVYILIFFFTIVVLIFGYFTYKIFFSSSEFKLDFLTDLEFSKLTEREDEKEENEYEEIVYSSCKFGEKEILHQEAKVFFSRASIGAFESCEDFSSQRTCSDGLWLGNPRFKFSSCERTIDCKFDEETIIKNGESIILYSRDSVPFGENCENYKSIRLCNESILTGSQSFQYKVCTVDRSGVCEISGITLGNEQSRTFFSKGVVPFGESCENYMQKRICSSGTLYGDGEYSLLSCVTEEPKKCVTDAGVEISHNKDKILYSAQTPQGQFTCVYLRQKRNCFNGILDGDEEYKYESCQD